MNALTRQIVITATAMLLMAGLAVPALASPLTPPDKYVRTANYFLKAGTDIRPEHYARLASYDLLVLPAEAQIHNRQMFRELRRLNPDLTILAYVPSKSYNDAWNDALHRQLLAGIDDSWWLLDSAGRSVSVWPGTRVVNGVSGWSTYLPQFVDEQIWSTSLWDGVFYDEFSANISWLNDGDLDLHRRGAPSEAYLADAAWQRSMVNLLHRTRERLGADAVIVTNGDSTAELQPHVNGRMFESFPTPWEAGGTWSGVMANYIRLFDMVGYAPTMIINANTSNTGRQEDYRWMRFSLCSTLLGDGYFSFDYGDLDHGQLWRYDEYDVRLGRPLGRPLNVLAPAENELSLSVWRRDYQNGVVLVNATDQTQTVRLEASLEKLRGTQDPQVNDGSLVDTVALPPEDGLILLKPMSRLLGSAFPNGAYARVFDRDGHKIRNGFFAYVPPFSGQANIALADLNGDGGLEKVVADRGAVSVHNGAGELLSFRPYGPDYDGTISLAVKDVNSDGALDILTGAGPGLPPEVKIYTADGQEKRSFYAYDYHFRGGINVAAGNLFGPGHGAIVVGAGPGGGPHVRIFTPQGRLLHPGFFAYDPLFRGGVRVAVGDLNGDGWASIVTGAGPGGGPHVRIFNSYGRLIDPGFFAADPDSRAGVLVATTDTDGDHIDEIASLTTDIFRLMAVE